MATYEICRTLDSYRAALGVVYRAYRELGYIKTNEEYMRVIPHHHLSTTEVLLSRDEDGPLSTATIVRDSEMGLPMEPTFSDVVDGLRAPDILLAEAVCLADRRYPKPSQRAILRMTAMVAQVSAKRGVTNLLAVVHPRHVGFYTKFFGFVELSDQRDCGYVRHSPGVAIGLDIFRMSGKFRSRAFEPPFSDNILSETSDE